jgi:hypothetical protein
MFVYLSLSFSYPSSDVLYTPAIVYYRLECISCRWWRFVLKIRVIWIRLIRAYLWDVFLMYPVLDSDKTERSLILRVVLVCEGLYCNCE